MKTLSFSSGNRQAGFSLVDVMVGMVLGLIGTIIIFQVFEASERVKRTTTSGGDAQQNGVAALFALERGVRQAGYGFNTADRAVTPAPAPLAITTGAANAPDVITIKYRPSNAADCPVSAPTCAWEYGPFSPDGNTVFMSQAPGAVTPPLLTTLNYCVTTDLNTGKAVLMSRTVACTAGANGDDIVLVEGIVQLKALPVLDATNQMVAVQMAIVARSSQPEKPDPDGVCRITIAAPAWTGGALDLSLQLGLAPGDDWKCFRYKTFTVTVPLRNVLWKP